MLVKYLLRVFAIFLGLVVVQSSTNNLSVCEDLLFADSTSLRVFQNLCALPLFYLFGRDVL